MSEVKRYSFDEICESQDFNHEEAFILASDYEHLKTKLELTNKELGLNIKSHLDDICTLEKLKAQLEKALDLIEHAEDTEPDEWYKERAYLINEIEAVRAREYFKEKEQM